MKPTTSDDDGGGNGNDDDADGRKRGAGEDGEACNVRGKRVRQLCLSLSRTCSGKRARSTALSLSRSAFHALPSWLQRDRESARGKRSGSNRIVSSDRSYSPLSWILLSSSHALLFTCRSLQRDFAPATLRKPSPSLPLSPSLPSIVTSLSILESARPAEQEAEEETGKRGKQGRKICSESEEVRVFSRPHEPPSAVFPLLLPCCP